MQWHVPVHETTIYHSCVVSCTLLIGLVYVVLQCAEALVICHVVCSVLVLKVVWNVLPFLCLHWDSWGGWESGQSCMLGLSPRLSGCKCIAGAVRWDYGRVDVTQAGFREIHGQSVAWKPCKILKTSLTLCFSVSFPLLQKPLRHGHLL